MTRHSAMRMVVAMSNMKVVSLLDAELVKARRAQGDALADVLRQINATIVNVADALTALDVRTADLELAVAGLGERVKALEQRSVREVSASG